MHYISTVDSVYDEPNADFFNKYVDFIEEVTNYEEVPDYLIPLNPPPVPKLIENGYNASFMRNFKEAPIIYYMQPLYIRD